MFLAQQIISLTHQLASKDMCVFENLVAQEVLEKIIIFEWNKYRNANFILDKYRFIPKDERIKTILFLIISFN